MRETNGERKDEDGKDIGQVGLMLQKNWVRQTTKNDEMAKEEEQKKTRT